MKAEVCEVGAVEEGMCLDYILSYGSLESCGQKAWISGSPSESLDL